MPEGWVWHPENTVDLGGDPALILSFDDEPPPPVTGEGALLEVRARGPLETLRRLINDRQIAAISPKRAVVNSLKSATVGAILAARRHGVRDFYLVDSPGSLVRSNTRGAVALTAARTLRRKLAQLPVVPGLIERALGARLNPPWPSPEATELAVELVAARTRAPRPAPSAPFRIVHLIGSLGPGGAERQLTYLAKGAAERGHDVSVISCSLQGASAHYLPDLEEAGVHVSELIPYGYYRLLPDLEGVPFAERVALESHCARGTVFALVEALRERAPDVVHCWLDATNTAGALAALLAGVPRILISLRSVNPSLVAHLYRPWLQSNYRALAGSPHVHVLANSHAAAESYATWANFPQEWVRVVRNGFPLERWPVPNASERAEARRAFGIPDDAFVIAGVLRLSDEKHPLDFVRAVAKVRDQLPNVRALHAGAGPLGDAVRAEAERLNLGETLTFLGQTSALGPLRAASDVGLLTSRVESCPNVLLEFQAAARPVVTTRAGGAPETLRDGETGLIAEVGDVDALAGHLLALAADPVRREQMGHAARALVAERFAIDAMIEQTLSLYGSANSTP